MRREKVIDADFELVSGPFREGDEHPDKPGWYWTGKKDEHGDWLWYQPPNRYWLWVRRLAWTIWIGSIVGGILLALIFGV